MSITQLPPPPCCLSQPSCCSSVMYRPTDRPVIRPDTTLISLMQSLIISRQQTLGGFRCVCANDDDGSSDYDDTRRHFECDAVPSWYINADVCEESPIFIVPAFYLVHGRRRFFRNVGKYLKNTLQHQTG